MKPRKLKCMLTYEGNVYVATCLTLSLGAQADTAEEAKSKLEAQIDELFQDARENPHYAKELLNRPAPLSLWLEYYCAYAIYKLGRFIHRNRAKVRTFSLRENCTA